MSIHETHTRPERITSPIERHDAAASSAAHAAHAAFHAEIYGSPGAPNRSEGRKMMASNEKDVPGPNDIVHKGTFTRPDGTLEPVIIIETPHEFK